MRARKHTSHLVVLALALAAPAVVPPAVADPGSPQPAVAVAAALHEGRVTFSVDHPLAASMQVQVFAEAGGEPIFDSGVRPVRQVIWPTGRAGAGGWRYVVKAWSAEGVLLTTQVATADGLDRISEIPFDSLPAGVTAVAPAISLQAPVDVGTSTIDGEVAVFRDGATSPTARLYGSFFDLGGGLSLLDESGSSLTTGIIPDVDGQGGMLIVQRTNGDTGFQVDGNFAGTGNPKVSVTGSARAAVLDMSQPRNASVVLPVDAIGSAEILGEAGLGADRDTGGGFIGTPIFSDDPAAPTVLLTRTLEVPVAGHVLAIATSRLTLGATSGSSNVTLGVTEGTAMTDLEYYASTLDGLETTLTAQDVFAVGPGAHTFRLAAISTQGNAIALDRQLTVLFFPSAYGTVTTAPTGGGAAAAMEVARPAESVEGPHREGLSEEEIAAERRSSLAEARALRASELDAMGERLEELRQELAALNAAAAAAAGAE